MSDEGGVADMGSQLSATSSSSCYTVNRVGRELVDNNQDFRGSVTIRVTAGRDHVEEKEKEERRSRFEAEKEAVMRIYSSSLHNTGSENGKVQNTISKGGSGQERERRERRRREGKKEKRDRTGEGGGGRVKDEKEDNRYENVLFNGEGKAVTIDHTSEEVYDKVKLLRNSVREVNEIVQSEGDGRYKAVLIHVRGDEDEEAGEEDHKEEVRLRPSSRRETWTDQVEPLNNKDTVPLYDHPRPLGPRPVASVSCHSISSAGIAWD